jgi:hypothetical protein
MIILYQDGTIEGIAGGGRADDTTRDWVELPIDLIAQQNNLLDRVFALAFDVLGLATIELRVRAAGQETLSRAG